MIFGSSCLRLPRAAAAPRRDLRVELLEAAARGVALVGEGLLAGRGLFGVEAVEGPLRHEHFAAHLEVGRETGAGGAVEFERDVADRSHVLHDGLALDLVAARHGVGKDAVAVHERNGEAVVFRLVGEGDRLARKGVEKLRPRRGEPFAEFHVGIDVLDRLHRDDMADLAEGALDVGADALRGGSRKDASRGALKLLEALELHVELVVRHGRVVLDVVLVARPCEGVGEGLLVVGVAACEVFKGVCGNRFHDDA